MSIRIDREHEKIIVTTNDVLINQLKRDGPKIARNFDALSRKTLHITSAYLSKSMALVPEHLPRMDDRGFKATSARLLANAHSTYIASVEVARHGFPRQYGVLARHLLEKIATVVVLGTREDALDRFYENKLPSPKCVGWAKAVLPPLGTYYGMLSDHFAHVSSAHAVLELPKRYQVDDESLRFVQTTLKANVWLLNIVTELVFADEITHPVYWQKMGDQTYAFDPAKDMMDEIEQFLLGEQ